MKLAALLIAVNKKNEILLQHKDSLAPNFPNKWCLFGGGIEDETPDEAIKREMKEELDWEINDFTYFMAQESDSVHREVFVIKTNRTANDLLKHLHEGNDLNFFSESKIVNLDTAKPHQLIISEYFSRLSNNNS